MEHLQARLEALERILAEKDREGRLREARLAALEGTQRRLRLWQGATTVLVVMTALVIGSGGQPAVAQQLPVLRRLALLEQLVARHQRVVRFFTPGRPQIAAAGAQFVGAAVTQTGDLTLAGNLYVVNGQGKTQSVNGSGNLIVGYNETGNRFGDTRTGSHNLILGNKQSYISAGGLLAGQDNTTAGAYATVTGGSGNFVGGDYASISGGYINEALGDYSAINGGEGHDATGDFSTISGGSTITQGNAYGWSAGSAGNMVSGRFRSP